ncbi:MAG: PIG-L family deacetylase [Bacteroidetes bacterium]|nr:PIG-L family deacetylase [Bacteroidota bacterium]
MDTVKFFDLDYKQWRKDFDVREEELYFPIAKEKFAETFNQKIVEDELTKCVNDFNPSVIFTLDNEIGGYGHPEHVFISQLTLDLAQSKKISAAYIYQSVYTPHMATSIMARHSKRMIEWGFAGDGWNRAKETYKVNGMPQPTTQIYITSEAAEKMDYLKSYNEREQKTIGFFIPSFFEYSAEEYFKIFDREFFNVIKIN